MQKPRISPGLLFVSLACLVSCDDWPAKAVIHASRDHVDILANVILPGERDDRHGVERDVAFAEEEMIVFNAD